MLALPCNVRAMCMEHIYSDALALRMKGRREVLVGSSDRVDVFVPGCLMPGGEGDLLIEVKRAAAVRDAIGQVNSYAARWPSVCRRAIHLIYSANRLQRLQEVRRVDEHRRSGEFDGIQVSSEIERTDLPDAYQLAGLSIPRGGATSATIQGHVKQIQVDFLVSGYLYPAHRDVLMHLAQAWMKERHDASVISITPSVGHGHPAGGGRDFMMVMVHGAGIDSIHLPVAEAISAWLRREHWRWLSAPQSLGVCRKATRLAKSSPLVWG